jgi:hypothetical protein
MMIEWVLVIFVHSGAMSKTDSVALTSIPGFSSAAECQAAGKESKKLTDRTIKGADFACLQRKRN